MSPPVSIGNARQANATGVDPSATGLASLVTVSSLGTAISRRRPLLDIVGKVGCCRTFITRITALAAMAMRLRIAAISSASDMCCTPRTARRNRDDRKSTACPQACPWNPQWCSCSGRSAAGTRRHVPSLQSGSRLASPFARAPCRFRLAGRRTEACRAGKPRRVPVKAHRGSARAVVLREARVLGEISFTCQRDIDRCRFALLNRRHESPELLADRTRRRQEEQQVAVAGRSSLAVLVPFHVFAIGCPMAFSRSIALWHATRRGDTGGTRLSSWR